MDSFRAGESDRVEIYRKSTKVNSMQRSSIEEESKDHGVKSVERR